MNRRPSDDSRAHEQIGPIRRTMWTLRMLTLLIVGFLAFALFLLAPEL
jgi:hypothetical protein